MQNHDKVSIGKLILETKKQKKPKRNLFKVSNIDFYQIPEMDATSSAYSLEGKCEPEPLSTNEHDDDPRLEGYRQVDTENVPPEDKAFYKQLIKAFRHVFFVKTQFRMIRDRRVQLDIRVDPSKLPKTEAYGADPHTTKHIEEMFQALCELGVAKPVDNTSLILHYSPCYLRVRSTEDMDKMKQDKNYVPKKRLISNYAGLNRGIMNIPPITYPGLRNMILQVGQTKYSGTADIRACFRSYPVTEEASRYLCIVTPANTVYRVLQCIEGISIVPAFVTSHVMDSMVFSAPNQNELDEDKELFKKNPDRLIKNLDDMAEYLRIPGNRDCPRTKTKPELKEEDADSSIYRTEIERIHDKSNKLCHTARVIRREDVHPDLYAKETGVITFIDDVRMYAQTREDYRRILISFLIDINNMGLALAGEKFHPYAIYDSVGYVEFLGFRVYSDYYEARPQRIESLKALTYPTTVKGIQKCLGMFQFLSDGCNSMMALASKIYDRMTVEKKGKSFQLTEEEKYLFDKIKDRLSENKPLYIPNPDKDLLVIETDASQEVYAAVLYAITEEGVSRVISYYSKKFPVHYRKSMSIPMKELIAIITAFHYWRVWIYSFITCYRGDCLSIISLMLHRRASDDLKLERMLIKLRSYPLRYICHVRTNDNAADLFTRMEKYEMDKPPFTTPTSFEKSNNDDLKSPLVQGRKYSLEEMQEACDRDPKEILPTIEMNEVDNIDEKSLKKDFGVDLEEDEPWLSAIVMQNTDCVRDLLQDQITIIEDDTQGILPGQFTRKCGGLSTKKKLLNIFTTNHMKKVTTEYIVEEQMKDQEFRQIILDLQTKKKKSPYLGKYELVNDIMLMKVTQSGHRIALNTRMAMRIFTQIHILLHCSAHKLTKVAGKIYHVKGMKNVAEAISQVCLFCSAAKEKTKPNYPSGMIPKGLRPKEHLSMDFVVFSKTRKSHGKAYIGFLNCVCHYTQYIFATPVSNQKDSYCH